MTDGAITAKALNIFWIKLKLYLIALLFEWKVLYFYMESGI